MLLFLHFMVYLYVAMATYVYFFPGILALIRRHPNAGGVIFTNLAIAWTIIGWFVLYVWVFDRE